MSREAENACVQTQGKKVDVSTEVEPRDREKLGGQLPVF